MSINSVELSVSQVLKPTFFNKIKNLNITTKTLKNVANILQNY